MRHLLSPSHHSILLVLLTILLAVPVAAQTNINGNMSGSLTLGGHPYTVTGSITVPAGQTLTVEAGVVVNFNPSTSMTVYGTLDSQGTPADPVVFSATNNTSGSWLGIFTGSDSNILLDHTWIEYAGTSGYSGLHSTSAANQIIWDGGGARHCLYDGVGASADIVDIRNCQFHDNGRDGCSVTSGIEPARIQDSSASGNGRYAMRINSNLGDILGGLSGSGNLYNGIYVSGTLNPSPPRRLLAVAEQPRLPGHHQHPEHQCGQPPAGGERLGRQVPDHQLQHLRQRWPPGNPARRRIAGHHLVHRPFR